MTHRFAVGDKVKYVGDYYSEREKFDHLVVTSHFAWHDELGYTCEIHWSHDSDPLRGIHFRQSELQAIAEATLDADDVDVFVITSLLT